MNKNDQSEKTIEIGTEIYYTGDMANQEGCGAVIAGPRNGEWLVGLDDGRAFWVSELGIGTTYNGTCNPRFVLASARRAFREDVMSKLQRAGR